MFLTIIIFLKRKTKKNLFYVLHQSSENRCVCLQNELYIYIYIMCLFLAKNRSNIQTRLIIINTVIFWIKVKYLQFSKIILLQSKSKIPHFSKIILLQYKYVTIPLIVLLFYI